MARFEQPQHAVLRVETGRDKGHETLLQAALAEPRHDVITQCLLFGIDHEAVEAPEFEAVDRFDDDAQARP